MRRPLRIALVAGSIPKLSETFVLQQIVSLLAEGHDVRVFAFDQPSEPTMHADVHRLRLLERTTYLRNPRHVVNRFVALLQKPFRRAPERFDAIICHFGPNGENARLLRKQGRFAGPLAVFFHAFDLTSWLRRQRPRFYAPLFAEAELLLPISHHWKQRLAELGAPLDKVVVRHMGVDVSKLTDQDIGKLAHERARRFLEDAPTTAAEAATIILDGVKAERWRILVGKDAEKIDQMVRQAPEKAYDADFFQTLAKEVGWKLGAN